MIRRILILVAILAAFGLGGWLSWQYFKPAETITQVESSILLEKVQNVCKLVTVEGNFVEVYDEKNIRQLTFYLPIPTTWNFSKTALLEVKGKVLVGFDMEKIRITADSTNKVIRLSNLPLPEVLSIDHTVAYKNLEESFFNSFDAEDFTQLNENARKVLEQKAIEDKLIEQAATQGSQMLDAIRFIVERVGWELVIESPVIPDIEEVFVN